MTPSIDKIVDLVGETLADWLPALPEPVPTSNGTPNAGLTDQQVRTLQTFRLLMAKQRELLNQLDYYKKKLGADEENAEPEPPENFFASQKFRDGLQMGVYMFMPYLAPLQEVAEAFPAIRPFGLDISASSFIASLREYQQEADARSKAFEQSIEGAIRNPTSLDDLSKGDLFVIDEDALNEIIGSILKHGPAGKKLRNVKVKIDGDELKISGEYQTKLMWVDFTARLEFEQKDGKTTGSLRKITAVGLDLTSMFQEDIIAAFRQFNIEPPDDAQLKDLSWVHLPGIKRLEIRRDLIILEREPAPTGPT